jgi:hypothetical protein
MPIKKANVSAALRADASLYERLPISLAADLLAAVKTLKDVRVARKKAVEYLQASRRKLN